MLTKRLTQIGNSVGLILDRPLLDLLDLEPGSEVQLQVEENRLIISHAPSPGESRPAVRSKVVAAHKRVLAKHAGTFRKLAK
jgi:antitoxin component of MazEF toxin-antitoxin module